MSINNLTGFSERIKAVREASGLNRGAFGKSLNVSGAYIGQLESGKKANPSALFLNSVEKEYKVSRVWLESGKGEMKPVRTYAMAESSAEYQLPGPISLDADRQKRVLISKLQRILDEGDKVKIDAIKAQLKAFDPGEKKQDADCAENEGIRTAPDRAA